MTINVQGPDGSNFAFPDGTPEDVITGAMAKHYGRREDAAAPKPEAAPITTNDVVRAAATGVPVVGGVLNKLNAATAATVAPVVEPLMAPGPDDISRPGPSTQRIGDVPVPAPAPSWRERYDRSLAIQEGMDKRFQREHPYVDLAAKIAGGVGGTLPAMLAAPAAFGLTGPLPQMVTRGAASNAALGAVDAAVRGESPVAPAAVGAAVGAAAPVAARAVGKMVQGVRDWRNPPPVVPQNVERVAGSDIPLTTGQAAGDPIVQAEEEIMRRGARGASAEAVARKADEEAQAAVAEASGNIGRMLDPRSVPAATSTNPVPEQFRLGTKDDTGLWFLGSDKPIYANAQRSSLDGLFGPQVAAGFDKFPSVSGVNKNGQPITVWHKPGEEARALREVENFKRKAEVSADPVQQARLHYESGLNLGYDEPVARGYVEKRFGEGILGDPSARTAPQAAGQVVQAELAQQEAARAAAAAAEVSRVAAEGESLARGLGGGAAPVSPFDAAETTGAAVAARRNAAVEAKNAAYKARDAVEGTFEQSVPDSMSEEIRRRVARGDASERLHIDRTNESTAAKALKVIDNTLFENLADPAAERVAVAPARAIPVPAVKATEDETVAALRSKFGDSVADAYAKQNQPPPLSLLEFVASKGGLRPDAELDAIGLNQAHRSQIPGQSGFFGTVRKNGSDLDRMLEAAEEAGYLRGENGATSTPRQFLDAIDAELRGQKQFPAGREGFKNKRETAAASARETAEFEQLNRGFEDDLRLAGHGELGPDVKKRAVDIMREEGMSPDEAVDTAFRQLEQEDAANAVRSAASDFPGDKPMGQGTGAINSPVATSWKQFTADRMGEYMRSEGSHAAAMKRMGVEWDTFKKRGISGVSDDALKGASTGSESVSSRPVDLKTMDEARKQLVTMLKDAKRSMLAPGGNGSDYRAVSRILHEFDNVIDDALKAGKFTGDAELAKRLQSEARQAHADYKQTFSSRGPGDEIGRKVEKILGRYNDDAATAEEIAAMSYGPKSNPGTGSSVKVGLRLKKILGENSPEFAQWKAGAFAHVDDESLTPAKRAARLDNFLGTSWAKAILTPQERTSMATYSRNLRATEPKSGPSNELDKALARISGADGHLPATPLEVADMLYSRTGKGDKGISQHLAAYLKQNLTPESMTAVRQGMWEKLTSPGEGLTPFGPQALSQRLNGFLNENGKGLAEILFTKAERAEMAKLASVYKRMAPKPGTTNPSGSATIGAKIAKGALDNLGAMLGFGAGGIPGALTGHLVQKGGAALKDARAAKEATRLFFGAQPRRAAQSSRLPVLLAPAVPASQR